MSKTLFEIGADLNALNDLLEETGGEVTDIEVEKAIDKWLSENRDNLAAKLDGYAHIIDRLEHSAGFWKNEAAYYGKEAARLKGHVQTNEANIARLKRRLCEFFLFMGMQKIETPLHKFSIQSNGGEKPLVYPTEWNDRPNLIPAEYQKTITILDKEKLRTALEMGQEIEGCKIGEPGYHLRIR